MNAVAKVLVIFVLLLSAAFATSQILLFRKREDYGKKYLEERQARAAAQKQLTDAQAQLAQMTRERDDWKAKYESETASLRSELQNQKDRVAELTKQVEQMAASVQQLTAATKEQEARLATREQTVDQLKNTLAERDATIQQNLDKINQLQDAIAQRDATIGNLQLELNAAKKKNVELAETTRQLQDKIAGLIRRGIEIEPALAPPINGRIIKVDTSVGAAVIDKGALAGVKPNTEFTVYRGDDYVASLVIHRVEDQLSVGRLRSVAKGKTVQQGDKVTTEVRAY